MRHLTVLATNEMSGRAKRIRFTATLVNLKRLLDLTAIKRVALLMQKKILDFF